jgi:hypothetical protein
MKVDKSPVSNNFAVTPFNTGSKMAHDCVKCFGSCREILSFKYTVIVRICGVTQNDKINKQIVLSKIIYKTTSL